MLYFTDNKIQILITGHLTEGGHLTDGRLVEVRLYFLVVFKLIAQETQKHVRLWPRDQVAGWEPHGFSSTLNLLKKLNHDFCEIKEQFLQK